MLAMGAGGLDVAAAMAGQPFSLTCPKVMGIRLAGSLPPGVDAKNIILELLRRLTVKGGVGRVLEYHGPGRGRPGGLAKSRHMQHGRGTGRHRQPFPQRRSHRKIHGKPGQAGGPSPAVRRSGLRIRRNAGIGPGRPGAPGGAAPPARTTWP